MHRSYGLLHPQVAPSRAALLSFRRPASRAFTLIELLTVIAIIGILAAILIPTVARVRSQARKAQCVSNLRQWGDAIRLFANDHKGYVALYLDVGEPVPDANGVLYSKRIYNRYFGSENMVDSLGNKLISAQEAMARCPAMMSVEGTSDPDFIKRCYAFTRPYESAGSGKILAKRFNAANPNPFGLEPGTDLFAYDLSQVLTPSRFVAMFEQAPLGTGSDTGRRTVNKPDDLAGYVLGIQTGTGGIKRRHEGLANALFADGHVLGLSATETDYAGGTPEVKAAIENWFRPR